MAKKILSAIIGFLIASVIYGSLLLGVPKINTKVIKNIRPNVELKTQTIAIKPPQPYQLSIKKVIDYKTNGTVVYFRKNPMWFWEKPKPVEVVDVLKEGGTEEKDNDTSAKPNNNKVTEDQLSKVLDTVTSDSVLPLNVEYMLISSSYGNRKDPFTKSSAYHTGIDFSHKDIDGKPIYSLMNGKVKTITLNNKNGSNEDYGNLVVIEYETFTVYLGHLKKVEKGLEIGEEVKTGQILGYVGNTGRSTGPHLHFEVRIDNTPIDPSPLLTKIKSNQNVIEEKEEM